MSNKILITNNKILYAGQHNDETSNNFYDYDSDVYKIKIVDTDKILVGGHFHKSFIIGGSFESVDGFDIRHFNGDTYVDSTADEFKFYNSTDNEIGRIYDFLKQSDDKLVIGGRYTKYDNVEGLKCLVRINGDTGARDTSFDIGTGFDWSYTPGIADVWFVGIQSTGKIIVGGTFDSFNSTTVKTVVRLNTNGSLDSTFNNNNVNNTVFHGMVLSNDKILVSGTGNPGMVKLNADGSTDTGFALPSSVVITDGYDFVVQSDDKIVVVGDVDVNSSSVRIVRLNSDGSLDTSLNPGTGFNVAPRSIALQSDGKFIIGGGFTSYNGTAVDHIIRLNSDGSIDSSFNPGTGFDSNVYSICILPDTSIVMGGTFTTYNGNTRQRIVKTSSNGTDVSYKIASNINGEYFIRN